MKLFIKKSIQSNKKKKYSLPPIFMCSFVYLMFVVGCSSYTYDPYYGPQRKPVYHKYELTVFDIDDRPMSGIDIDCNI